MTDLDKRSLSKRDICTQFITPAVQEAGWDLLSQIREQVYFTKGRIIVRGKLVTRGKAKFADYILYYKPNLPIALIEAKDNSYPVGGGIQQGLEYAATLDIPFVFHDRTGQSEKRESELPLKAFPKPEDLWKKYRAWKVLAPAQEEIVLQNYHDDGSGKEPRYYQRIAIKKTIEAIAKGQNRLLLVMATSTGKTYTAFHQTRTRRECPQAGCLHQIRQASLAPKVSGRRCCRPRRSADPQDFDVRYRYNGHADRVAQDVRRTAGL